MIFGNCIPLDLGSKRLLIDGCLQALFLDKTFAKGVLQDLELGESSGSGYAFIYVDTDWENEIPKFQGICFEYLDEKVIVDKKSATEIILKASKQAFSELSWKGFGDRK